jgi:hypothetical protein
MADNLTAGTSLASIPNGTVIATHDLSGNGGTGHAQKIWTFSGQYVCTGSDVNITIGTSTAVKDGAGLTVPSNTSHVLLTVETQDIRMREDNTAPTNTNGILLTAGTMIELPLPATASFLQFISSSASVSGKVNISYRSYR